MPYQRPANISVGPVSTPSDLLSQLEAIIIARKKLREEQEKVSAGASSIRLQWVRELASEVSRGINIQTVVSRCKDLEGKEQRYKEQQGSLARSLHEIDHAIRHYEQAHRQDLLQALHVRLEHVGEARKEYEELEKWRDELLRKPRAAKPVRGTRRAPGESESEEDQ
jgi:hypothetical protein